jgi:hypothetical protein
MPLTTQRGDLIKQAGPITRRIQHAYGTAIHGEDAGYRHWLTPVKA